MRQGASPSWTRGDNEGSFLPPGDAEGPDVPEEQRREIVLAFEAGAPLRPGYGENPSNRCTRDGASPSN